MRYDSKVSTIEEWDDIELMTVDQIHGIFTAYEMRTRKDGLLRKEAAFKVSKETKRSKSLSKNFSKNSDDEEYIFIKKLERGTGKYKGKIPLKCFKCGKIGHYASKCPYPKQEDSDDEEPCSHKKYQKSKTTYNKKFKKKKLLFHWW